MIGKGKVIVGGVLFALAAVLPFNSVSAQAAEFWDYYLQTPAINTPRADAMSAANTGSFQRNAAEERWQLVNQKFWLQHDYCCMIHDLNPWLDSCPAPAMQAVPGAQNHYCHRYIRDTLREED